MLHAPGIEPVQIDCRKLRNNAAVEVTAPNSDLADRLGPQFGSAFAPTWSPATSRLLTEAMHVVVKGPSAVGKSRLRQRGLVILSPRACHQFHGVIGKSPAVYRGRLRPQVLSMGEAIKGKQQEFQDMCPILLAVRTRRSRSFPRAAAYLSPKLTTTFSILPLNLNGTS